MNFFPARQSSTKHSYINREDLPELNAFVNLDAGGKNEVVPVEAIGLVDFQVRRAKNVSIGTTAAFNYTNDRGRLRFEARCTAIYGRTARFSMPTEIAFIAFDAKRSGSELKHVLPVVWRYAPDGVGYGEYVKSTTGDLSITGFSLVVPRELRTGTQVEVKLDLDPSAKPFIVAGSLIGPTHKQPNGKFIAGFVFDKLNAANALSIGEFIESRQNRQRKRSLAEEQ